MGKKNCNIKIYKDTTIYILACPWFISGGSEALHQIVYYLTKSGYNAVLAFFNKDIDSSCEIPKQYKKYVNSFCIADDIVDDKKMSLSFQKALELNIIVNLKMFKRLYGF